MGVFPRCREHAEMQPFIVSSSELPTSPPPSIPSSSAVPSSPTSSSSVAPPPVKTLYTVRGRVCSRRPFAKCMLFFDLVDAATRNQTRGDLVIRLECLLHAKGLAGLEKANVKKMMHDVHMGDVLEVDGFLDTRHEFLVLEARAFRIVESWKSLQTNPRIGFVLEWPCASPEKMAAEAEAGAATAAAAAVDKLGVTAAAEAAAATPTSEASTPSNHSHSNGTNGNTIPHPPNNDNTNNTEDEEALQQDLPPLLLDNVCKYWVATQGRCYQTKGGCPKFHPTLSQLPRYYTAWLAKRQKERAHASQIEGDTHPPEDKTKKAFRAVLFADWLVETYGRERLGEGSGVVDVAGGKGDVSCRLWGEYGIKCTIVDPRQTKFRKKVQQQVLKQRGGMEGIGRIRCVMPTCFDFEEEGEGEEREEDEEEKEGEGDGRTEEEEERRSRRRLWRVLRDCSVVVGMHPDQATDGIFDVAFAFGKPVACVPCCVFAREFSHRRRPRKEAAQALDGREQGEGGKENRSEGGEGGEEEEEEEEEVESYEHLIDYLLAKPVPWPGAVSRRHFLPFLGRNQVLYSLPPSLSSSSASVTEGEGKVKVGVVAEKEEEEGGC